MKNMDNYIYDGWEEVRINSEDKKHIHVHENFISEEDLVKINEFCLTAEHIELNPLILIDYIPTVVKNYETEITKILRSYRDKICKLLEETYDCKININSGYSEISSISRYTPGTLLNPHADKVCESWRDLSNVLYFNDSYEGGEIYFYQYGIEFKPKAGTLLIFPSGANFGHGVKQITSGNRLVTSTFWVVEKWNSMDYANWQSYHPIV